MEALVPIETRAMSEKSHSEKNQNWHFLSLTPLFLLRRVEKGGSSACFFQLSRTYPTKHIYWRKMKTLEKKKRTENIGTTGESVKAQGQEYSIFI